MSGAGVTFVQRCQITGDNQVTAARTGLSPPMFYNFTDAPTTDRERATE
jgi:hypothetical protein